MHGLESGRFMVLMVSIAQSWRLDIKVYSTLLLSEVITCLHPISFCSVDWLRAQSP